jgi:PPM family protein phosphatase
MADDTFIRDAMPLSLAQLTNVGGRSSNQDKLRSAHRGDLACLVVSDGAGGHEGGEIASCVVADAVIEHFLQEPLFAPRTLLACIDHASTAMAQRKAREERLKDMSATVAAVLIDLKHRRALWAHLGDTRVYFFRERKVSRITRDHSLVQQFVDAGYCAPDQLRIHPQRNMLFAAIGAEGDTRPDVIGEVCEMQDGDALLVCTDGFWEWILEEEMELMLHSARTVAEWLHAMAGIVERNGDAAAKSRDNCTAAAVWFGECGKPDGFR